MAERIDLDARLTALAGDLAADAQFEARAVAVVDRAVERLAAERETITPNIVTPIEARRHRRRWSGSRLAVAAAIIAAVVAASLVVSPRARRAVADLLGIRGVRIERVPSTSTSAAATTTSTTSTAGGQPSPSSPATEVSIGPTTLPAPPIGVGDLDQLGLGERVGSPSAASSRLHFGLVTLNTDRAGPVIATFVRGDGDEAIATVVHQRAAEPVVMLTQFRATPDVGYFKKVAGGDSSIEGVEVGRNFGYWIAGEPHQVVLVGAGGRQFTDSARLAGPTLIWTVGDLTYRLEGVASRAEAIALAGDLVPVR